MSGSSVPPSKKSAQDYAGVRDWPGYFHAVLGKPARETLVRALELFEKEGRRPGRAADVGCGEGRDALELLSRGWRVWAIDAHAGAFELLLPRVPVEQRERLMTVRATFEEMSLPEVELVNASFALPFCHPSVFAGVWGRVTGALAPGGRFCGQLFGDRDTWATLPDRTHHTRAQAEAAFAGFELEMFNEEERDAASATGEPKHWHLYHIVARKL